MKISIGIARGLAYLHKRSNFKIVHRDIKPDNVLLDKEFNAKISDFGLARLYEDDHSQMSTRIIAGTRGYMAPEYMMYGHLTDKADVYSFGAVALEIISGKKITSRDQESLCLRDQAIDHQNQGNLLELVDPSLGSNYSLKQAKRLLEVALLCTNYSPTQRPSMSSVIHMLKGTLPIQVPVNEHRESNKDDDNDDKQSIDILSYEEMDGPSSNSSTLFTSSV